MLVLPFDAHNHVHMGPTPPLQALLLPPSLSASSVDSPSSSSSLLLSLSGMAIMSTHPRDFGQVLQLSQDLPRTVMMQQQQQNQQHQPVHVIPCFGVHPWFLHELSPDDWAITDNNSDDEDPQQVLSVEPSKDDSFIPKSFPSSPPSLSLSSLSLQPKWLKMIHRYVTMASSSHAIIGEIGLDGFHFHHPHNNATTPPQQKRQLVSTMEDQVHAFMLQMQLAHCLQKPVSIHCVHSFGPLLQCLSKLKHQLPPKLYFHAFGGKVGTIPQLLASCSSKTTQVYFGLAAVINFRSPKTAHVIRAIGLDRLVLETDQEDAALVYESMQRGIQYLAQALDVTEEEVIAKTTRNAMDFYGIIV